MLALRRAAILVVVAPLVTAPTRAQECGKPDLLHAFPPDGATVPPNSTLVGDELDVRLTAYYSPTAEYLGEEVLLEHVGATEDPVDAVFEDSDGSLTVVPGEPLVSGDSYVMKWPKLRGIGTASRGRGLEVAFDVGQTADTEAPTFDGIQKLSWDVTRDRDECTESQEERFIFDLELGDADDDYGTENLALLVFQQKGPNVSGEGAVPILVAPLPEDGEVRVSRAIADGTGEVCFAAAVKDLTGRVSGGADRVVCAKTIAPPFFYGCRAARAAAPTGSWSLFACASALALFFLRRHRPSS